MQHRQHILCFQGGPDAAPHWLIAIAEDAAQNQPELRSGLGQAGSQVLCRFLAAYFRGGAYGNVDDDMGRTGRYLLGQHRCDQLAFGVDVQFALDAHENVVGG